MAAMKCKFLAAPDVSDIGEKNGLGTAEVTITIPAVPDISRRALDLITSGNVSELRDMIGSRRRSGAPPLLLRGVTPQGNTLLHYAVRCNRLEAVKLVCEMDARAALLQTRNKNGDTPLHLAARAGHAPVVSYLVAKGEETAFGAEILAAANRVGDTPLHDAVRSGGQNKEAAEKLLGLCLAHCGSSFPQTNGRGESLLYLAAKARLKSVVSVLLTTQCWCQVEDGGPPNCSTALHAAVETGDPVIVQLLLASKQHLVKALDSKQRTPLLLAIVHGQEEMVQMLMDHDAAAGEPGGGGGCAAAAASPIHVAAEMGHVPIIETILERFPDYIEELNSKGQNVLHVAVLHERLQGVDYFLRRSFSFSCFDYDYDYELLVNQLDSDGNTPLNVAAATSNPEIIRTLLKDRRVNKKKNRAAANAQGLSPLGVFYSTVKPVPTLKWNEAHMLLSDNTKALDDIPVKAAKNAVEGETRKLQELTQGHLKNTAIVATILCTVAFNASLSIPTTGGAGAPLIREAAASSRAFTGFRKKKCTYVAAAA